MESYDAKRDLHHVKYADRDRADISMRHEAVVLLPGEEVDSFLPPVCVSAHDHLKATFKNIGC